MHYLINFSAFCLPLIIFTYWITIGFAALTILHSPKNTFQNLLLAPSVGMAMTVLFVFLLNRLEIPVLNFAKIVTISLLILSIAILWWRKPQVSFKAYLPFLGIFILALMVTGNH